MTEPEHPDYARCIAAQKHDPDAVQWLTERLQLVPRIVQRLAKRHGGCSRDDVQDMSQAAAKTALDRLDSYHGRAPFGAWVHEICVRTVLGYVRRKRRQAMATLEHEPPAEQLSPLEQIDQDERSQRVRDAVEQIGGVESDVVLRRALEDQDFADISASTGIPVATLRTRYYRGLKKLQARLGTNPQAPAATEGTSEGGAE